MHDRIQLIHDDWLSQMLKNDAFKLLMGRPGQVSEKEIRQNLGEVLHQAPVFVYTKIAVDALDCSDIVQTLGFRLVDTNVTFQKLLTNSNPVGNLTDIRFARTEDREEVSRIAGNSFRLSRFHLDPKIGNDIANTIKVNWATNYFAGKRGDAMVVSENGGRLSGFLQLLYCDDEMVIDLIAVDKEERRKHIASDMITFAESNRRGAKSIRVGTQVANLPSMTLYEKLGFHITDAAYVFHYHN